jgi:DNA-binding NarL/FixJ family response regulator
MPVQQSEAATPRVQRSTPGQRTVVVVDDHRAFAELLSAALEAEGMRVVGTAQSAAQAFAMVLELNPDVVVMDIQMPDLDGLAATRRIRQLAPSAVVAIVTAHHDPDWVVQAGQAGASAFIPKNGPLTEMLDTLTRVQAGQMLVAPSTFSGSRTRESVLRAAVENTPSFTRREREVLEHLAVGMQVKEIGRVLGIAEETCRGYIKALHTKLSARTQLEAVVKAQQLGLLDRTDHA